MLLVSPEERLEVGVTEGVTCMWRPLFAAPLVLAYPSPAATAAEDLKRVKYYARGRMHALHE